MPPNVTNVITVAAGAAHSLALRGDGSVVAWGDNSWGQISVPADATNIIALSAGGQHSLALKADGTVVAWGDNSLGQLQVPATVTNVIGIAAGHAHSLAQRADGTVVAWGDDLFGQTDVATNLTGVVAIAAGNYHGLALNGQAPAAPQISGAARNGKVFTAFVPTARGKAFFLFYKNSFSDTNWTLVGGTSGDNSQRPLIDPAATATQRFYRVRRQ